MKKSFERNSDDEGYYPSKQEDHLSHQWDNETNSMLEQTKDRNLQHQINNESKLQKTTSKSKVS